MTAREATATTTFEMVSVKSLRESKTNPRRHWTGIEQLAASVKQHGVLTPLLVRLHPGNFGDSIVYEIIAGARRFKAAQQAKVDQVPVRILDLTDEQALEFQVIENLQRADVHPIDEAAGFAQLLAKGKYDIAALALKVNKSESYIRQTLILNKLIPSAAKACFADKITAGHAKLLARLQPDDQAKALKAAKGTVRELSAFIQREILLELKYAPWDLDDATLLPSAGSCIACPKRTGASPQLFPDITQKDICSDGGCYIAKFDAQVRRNTENGLVSIATSSHYSSDGKKAVGVLYQGEYTDAGGKTCPHTKTAIVVLSNRYDGGGKLGSKHSVCVGKKCKTHGEKYYHDEGSSSGGKDPRLAAKERKTRAIGEARTEAVRQISVKVKWPLTETLFKRAVMSWYQRQTFESTKLACKILGIWPKDGKTGGFDFRGKLKAYIAKLDKHGAAKVAIVFMLLPDWGRWGGGYSGDSEEKQLLSATGRTFKVNTPKIERQFISTANQKAAKRLKAAQRAKAKAARLAKRKPHKAKAA